MKCNMDCENCTRPVSKCYGGSYKTANIIPHREQEYHAAKPSQPFYYFGNGTSCKPKRLSE